MSFEFTTVPLTTVGHGAARTLGAMLSSRYSGSKACLLTDRYLHQSGILTPVIENLGTHGWSCLVIDDVVADPPEDVVLSAAARSREFGADVIVGIGGGSSMDVAKLIAVLSVSSQSLQSMYGIGNIEGSRLPLVQIPTTAGTGSEATPIAIVTTGNTTKSGIVSPVLYADWAILDAELTLTLPKHATAATGIDAMVHAIEAYTSAHLKNPISDMLARHALALLSANILKVCADGDDIAAREAMLVGAFMAGQAFANAPVAAVHALAYPLGGHFHIPHGLSNALVLPHVLRFNLDSAERLYAELAEYVVPQQSLRADDESSRATAMIEQLELIIRMTGIPSRLRDLGIEEDQLDRLAGDAMRQERLLKNNPRPVNKEDARQIYQAAW